MANIIMGMNDTIGTMDSNPMAGQAVAPADPAAAVAALAVIEAEARTTLQEMRSLVSSLRDDDPALFAPTPGLADIEALASDDGKPPVLVSLAGPVLTVPETVGAAVYRIAQESVTNSRRHALSASGIQVTVTVDGGGDDGNGRVADGWGWVELTVTDDGRSSDRPAGAGFGVPGMTERARLLGGSLEAGPRSGFEADDGVGQEAGIKAGWMVRARLPIPNAGIVTTTGLHQ